MFGLHVYCRGLKKGQVGKHLGPGIHGLKPQTLALSPKPKAGESAADHTWVLEHLGTGPAWHHIEAAGPGLLPGSRPPAAQALPGSLQGSEPAFSGTSTPKAFQEGKQLNACTFNVSGFLPKPRPSIQVFGPYSVLLNPTPSQVCLPASEGAFQAFQAKACPKVSQLSYALIKAFS